MAHEDNKMMWIIAAAIIAAAVIVAVALNENVMHSSSGPEHVAATGEAGGVVSNGNTVSPDMTGMALRKKYADATIQFDQNCQATPNAPVYKNGSNVLFDNRSEAARVITLDAHQYTVPGYGYLVVNLWSSAAPHKFSVDCDFHQNVSTILVEK